MTIQYNLVCENAYTHLIILLSQNISILSFSFFYFFFFFFQYFLQENILLYTITIDMEYFAYNFIHVITFFSLLFYTCMATLYLPTNNLLSSVLR